jgi:Flp pilus assembly protein TadD
MKDTKSYEKIIKSAANSIKARNFLAAKEYIRKALMEDYHAPEPQNLIGILSELSGDCISAGKHYRAANALDATYKPSIHNLERITSFNYIIGQEDPDFGIAQQKSETANSNQLRSA